MLADQVDYGVELTPSETGAARGQIVHLLSSTPLQPDPFFHCQIAGLFPDPVYRKLLAAMRSERFEPVGNIATTVGYDKRQVLQFDTHRPSSESRRPAFWAAFTDDILFHPDVVDALIERCAPYTIYGSAARFRERPHRLTLHAIQDTGEYELTPHTDLCRKLATMLVYLPDVSGLPGEGTVLYRPREEGFTDRHGVRHHPVNAFEAYGTARYEPNNAFVFARTDHSFHGVRKLPPGGSRHLLQFTVQRIDVSDFYPEFR